VLHGRESEQRELLAAAAAAFAAGRSTSALVVGDAGIGKTRLAAEVADRLRDDGVRVAWAACRADGGAPPYWPVAQLLGTLGRADALDVAPAAEPEFARFLLFDAVAAALREAGPLLAVVDDLQWADLPTLRLLAALRAHLAAAPVVLVATVRESDPAAPQALGGLVADRHIVLRGLAAPDLAPVLAELTGVELDAVDAADLHARTGGNPFFAAEVVRMRRAGREDGVPGGVRAVLDRRLDGLPDGTEAVLRAAAALDAGVTAGVDATLLARVAGLALGTLAAEAGPATAAGLLRDDGGRYRFPHALVAETVAARTTPGERLDLHRRAASVAGVAGEAGPGGAAGGAPQGLAAGGVGGERGGVRAAAEAAEAAAMRAAAATAYEDAVTWLDAALAVSSGDDADPEGRRAALLCARGEALLAAGDPVASRESFAAAGTLARALGRADLLATAALGRTGGATGFEVDLVDPDRVVILDEARAALPADDSVLRTAVTARLSVALAFTAGEGRRRGLAEDAVATARRLGDARALAGALAAWCDAAAGPEHVADRRAPAAPSLAIAPAARGPAPALRWRRARRRGPGAAGGGGGGGGVGGCQLSCGVVHLQSVAGARTRPGGMPFSSLPSPSVTVTPNMPALTRAPAAAVPARVDGVVAAAVGAKPPSDVMLAVAPSGAVAVAAAAAAAKIFGMSGRLLPLEEAPPLLPVPPPLPRGSHGTAGADEVSAGAKSEEAYSRDVRSSPRAGGAAAAAAADDDDVPAAPAAAGDVSRRPAMALLVGEVRRYHCRGNAGSQLGSRLYSRCPPSCRHCPCLPYRGQPNRGWGTQEVARERGRRER